MVTFYFKGCVKGDVYFLLSINNLVPKSLKLVLILRFLVPSNYWMTTQILSFSFLTKSNNPESLWCPSWYDKVCSMLLSCEDYIQHHFQTFHLPISSTYEAIKTPTYTSSRWRFPYYLRNDVCGSSQGNYIFFTLSNPNLKCQLYDKPGHVVSYCYKHYRPHFLPPSSC